MSRAVIDKAREDLERVASAYASACNDNPESEAHYQTIELHRIGSLLAIGIELLARVGQQFEPVVLSFKPPTPKAAQAVDRFVADMKSYPRPASTVTAEALKRELRAMAGNARPLFVDAVDIHHHMADVACPACGTDSSAGCVAEIHPVSFPEGRKAPRRNCGECGRLIAVMPSQRFDKEPRFAEHLRKRGEAGVCPGSGMAIGAPSVAT